MTGFLQQVVSGLASGAVYGALALALVLVHRATGVVNFAQGEMATFSTYLLWTLTANHGWPYWPAAAVTLAVSFAGGFGVHQLLIRPLAGGPALRVVIVTVGLLLLLNGVTTWIWSGTQRSLESPFPARSVEVAGVAVSLRDLGTLGVSAVAVVAVWALFRYTRTGLALRAAAVHPAEARLVGVRVPLLLGIGWGLAAMLGAVAGALAAPSLASLDPGLMQATLVYAFAAAVLGGIDSPAGAVVGGLLLGVGLNLLGVYVDFVGAELRLPAALAVILVVVLLRPAGLLGRAAAGARS
jgi:branched-chain amino acid transport system permease protein